MKVRHDLQKGIKLYNGHSPRWVTGELDLATGFLMLDEVQGSAEPGSRQMRLKPGTYIHLPSRSSGERTDLGVVAAKASAKAKGVEA